MKINVFAYCKISFGKMHVHCIVYDKLQYTAWVLDKKMDVVFTLSSEHSLDLQLGIHKVKASFHTQAPPIYTGVFTKQNTCADLGFDSGDDPFIFVSSLFNCKIFYILGQKKRRIKDKPIIRACFLQLCGLAFT